MIGKIKTILDLFIELISKELNQVELILRLMSQQIEINEQIKQEHNKLNKIYKLINNMLYFQDIRVRTCYNLIYEIADVLECDKGELGKKFMGGKDE